VLPLFQAHALFAENTQTGAEIRIAYDMSFLWYWFSRKATILLGEIVVYQLEDQIVAPDLEKKKMGLVTRGLGPIVVLEGQKISLDKALETIGPKEAANYID
jgi:hypothetical protein